MNGKFFNCYDFEVKFRLFWLPNNPPISLKPGETIEGPVEYLKSFQFLRPIPVDFNRVATVTQDNKGQFLNYDDLVKFDIKRQEDLANKYKAELGKKEDNPTVDNEVIPVEDLKPVELPFDPQSVNWVKVSMDDLNEAAEMLGVDKSGIESLPAKKRKWELVRLIKKAVGLVS